AAQRYILIGDGADGYMGQVVSLSADERVALANSPEVMRFIDPNSWSPEMAPLLGSYQRYREELLKGTEPAPQDTSIPVEPQPTFDEILQIWRQIFEQPGIFDPQRG
ncbi:MAG TPA: hypothetical protein VLS96_07435, partial [Nodosilinea sp.]|nr:hypothetical protein [Nodosilinea sp.]